MSNLIVLVSIIMLTLLIGLHSFLNYYCESKQPHVNIVSGEAAVSLLKSGDLILFQAGDANPLRRLGMCGRYTHVGMVYRENNQVFVLDAGFVYALNLFTPLLQRYEMSKTQGIMAIRQLFPSLSDAQQEIFKRTIEQMKWKSRVENGGAGLTVNPSTGEWRGLRLGDPDLLQHMQICAANHIFQQNLSFDQHSVDYLCTDELMNCMREMQLINTSTLPSCLLPNHFSSEPRDTLNHAMLAPFSYGPEIQVTSKMSLF
jgi:hypothetical protein